MFRPKLLLSIKELDDMNKYPVNGYVLGYEKFTFFAPSRFSFEEIKGIKEQEKVYVLLNALIHENKLEEFKEVASKLSALKVNFIVQDSGALSVLISLVGPDRIIFNPYTLICNKNDFKAYQEEGVSGVGISSQLSFEECKELAKLDKSFILIYGYEPIYQSYRKVISLYEEAKKVAFPNGQLFLREDTRDDLYPVIENEYGSVIFNYQKVNLISKYDDLKEASYLYIDTYLSSEEEINSIIKELKR